LKPLFALILGISLFSCDKGEPLPNSTPETSIFLDKIELTGPDRLTSVVKVFWSGRDKDGFIKGFEISFDQNDWSFTTRSDTTFRFSLSQGQDTADVELYVRAVDDQDFRDPSPAFLRIPIKNTPPTVEILSDFQPADSSNTVFSLIWNTQDLDGDETLDSTYIRFNGGPWTALERNSNAIRVIPEDPLATGPVRSRILSSFTGAPSYTINFEREESTLVEGLVLDGMNTIYVRVRDKAGANSEPDTSVTFFLKRQTSDFLLIESHLSGNAVGSVYKDAFQNQGRSFDFINLFKNNAASDVRFWNFNFRLILDLYDRCLWYSGFETFSSGTLLLEIGIFQVAGYLNDGGKMLMTTYITGDLPNTSVLFNLTPMDSISPRDGTNQGRYFAGDIAIPDSLNPDVQAYPDLICSGTILNAAPFYKNPQARGFYVSEARGTGNWAGPDNIGSYFNNLDGNPNFYFFSVELHLFNGDQTALALMLNKIIDEEFNW
jgi:hypothetical protein